jgi:hypothetical protein
MSTLIVGSEPKEASKKRPVVHRGNPGRKIGVLLSSLLKL